MKLSRLYTNNSVFQPINFNQWFNVIFWDHERKDKPWENGVGKTKLLQLIDFMLWWSHSSFNKQIKTNLDWWAFFLEIEVEQNHYITISRFRNNAKISIKEHNINKQDYSNILDIEQEWNVWKCAEKQGIAIINSCLKFSTSFPYRTLIHYLLREQNDYIDPFTTSKYRKHKDWKPYLYELLGFNGRVLKRKYLLEEELDQLKKQIENLRKDVPESINEIYVQKTELEERVQKLRESSDTSPFKSQDFDDATIRELVQWIEREIYRLNREQYKISTELELINESLEETTITEFQERQFKEFFTQLEGVLSEQGDELKQRLIDVKNFQETLTLERNKYLQERKILLESDLDAIAKKYKSLDDKKEQHLRRLQESDLFKKYQSQQRDIAEDLERINKLERALAIHHLIEEYEKKRNKIEEEIKDLVSKIKSQNSYANYPELFTKISNLLKDTYSKVYDKTEKALIYVNTNHLWNPDFENRITDQKDNPLATDDGHTAKRILCALFILSIMAIYSEAGLNFFRFAYYDWVLESAWEGVKRNFIREIKGLCDKYNIQYFISVIRTDLPTDGSITNQDIVLTLSKNKKLFWKTF